MAYSDELVAAINAIHSRLAKAAAARDAQTAGDHYLTAAKIACDTISKQIDKRLHQQLAVDIERYDPAIAGEVLRNPDAIEKFLEAERALLIRAGMNRGPATKVIDMCLDQLDWVQIPKRWSRNQIIGIFNAAKFRFCEIAKEMEAERGEVHRAFERRRKIRRIFKVVGGTTLVVVNAATDIATMEGQFASISIAFGIGIAIQEVG